MFFKKGLFLALGAFAALVVCGVTTFPVTFEDKTAATALTEAEGWGGYGIYTNTESETKWSAAGTSVTNTASYTNARKVALAVEGWVTNDFTLASPATNDRQLDLLVKVALPDEELDGMSESDAKFAIAVETNGVFKYWSGTAWDNLSTNVFAEGTWVRVVVCFDSAHQRCKVTLDGSAATTGYRSEDNENDTTLNKGPWYAMLSETTTFSSMKVVGTAALDDISLGALANSAYVPSYIDPATGKERTVETTSGTEIPLSWFDQNDVAVEDAAQPAPDGSGMTVEEKYLTGFKPDDNQVFKASAMSMAKEDDVVTATVTVNVGDVPSGYEAVVTYGASKDALNDAATVGDGKSATVTFPNGGNVIYMVPTVRATVK